jgi:hypothetical protein
MSIILRSLPHRDSAAYGDGQAEERQTPMWVLATELPVSPSHPFGCARANLLGGEDEERRQDTGLVDVTPLSAAPPRAACWSRSRAPPPTTGSRAAPKPHRINRAPTFGQPSITRSPKMAEPGSSQPSAPGSQQPKGEKENGEPGGGQEKGGGGEFATPSPGDLGAEAVDYDAQAAAEGVPGDVAALKTEIENQLATKAGSGAQAQELGEEGGAGNIVGVGFAAPDAESISAGLSQGANPGDMGLALFTVERVEQSQLQAQVSSFAGTHALSQMNITQIPVGIVDALSHRMRMRPAPGGISVGHFQITAGTLGCLVIGQAGTQTRLRCLSNNHVLANTNNAQPGHPILQPGPYDNGKHPADQIAILENWVRINFASGAINYIDAAIGWCWPDRVRRELMYLSNNQPVFFRMGGGVVAPAVNMLVGKTGRTTQLTQGRITAINVTVNVNYGSGRVGHFRDQFSVRSVNANPFSAGGDSGSVVWQWVQGLPAVGLLFAGGGDTTFCGRISRALTAFNSRLYT